MNLIFTTVYLMKSIYPTFFKEPVFERQEDGIRYQLLTTVFKIGPQNYIRSMAANIPLVLMWKLLNNILGLCYKLNYQPTFPTLLFPDKRRIRAVHGAIVNFISTMKRKNVIGGWYTKVSTKRKPHCVRTIEQF